MPGRSCPPHAICLVSGKHRGGPTDHKVTESSRLEKTFKTIKSNHQTDHHQTKPCHLAPDVQLHAVGAIDELKAASQLPSVPRYDLSEVAKPLLFLLEEGCSSAQPGARLLYTQHC